MSNVTVKVLRDSVFGYRDGAKMRSRPVKAGELAEVADGPYADTLIASGLAAWPTVEVPEPTEETAEEEPTEVKPVRSRRKL